MYPSPRSPLKSSSIPIYFFYAGRLHTFALVPCFSIFPFSLSGWFWFWFRRQKINRKMMSLALETCQALDARPQHRARLILGRAWSLSNPSHLPQFRTLTIHLEHCANVLPFGLQHPVHDAESERDVIGALMGRLRATKAAKKVPFAAMVAG